MNKLKKQLPVILILIPLLLCAPLVVSASAESYINNMLWTFVANFFGGIFGLAGMLLNYGVNEFVIGFGANFLDKGIGQAVDRLWVTVRDLFNLTFIFGLVYIGFKMILNSDDSNSRRWLVNLIMAAILVNFSLYITKFIVDMSNILATQIANGFRVVAGKIDISRQFMDLLGMTSLLKENAGITIEGNAPYGQIFGTAIFLIVGIFVFGAGGLMLIIRYVILSLYMIFSPLMFLGWVFPGLSSVSNKYWKGFLGRAFFAPLYLLMLYLAAVVLKSFYTAVDVTSKGGFNEIFSSDGNTVMNSFEATIPPFIVATVFLIAAIVIASKLGMEGAAGTMNIMNRAKSRVQRGVQRVGQRGGQMAWNGGKAVAMAPAKAVGAGAGMVARRASYSLGNSLDAKVLKAQERGGVIANSVIGDKILRGGTKKMRDAKFGLSDTAAEVDKQKSTIDKRSQAARDRTAGIEAENNLNERQANLDSNIYDPTQDKVVKKDTLNESQLAAAAAAAKAAEERGETAHELILNDAGQVVNKGSLPPNDLERLEKAATKAKAEDEKLVSKMQESLNNMTVAQVEEMYKSQPEVFKQVVGRLRADKFSGLMSSDNLNNKQQTAIYEQRADAILNSISKIEVDTNGNPVMENGKPKREVLTDKLQYASNDQLETLGDEFIRANAHHLTTSQMEGLKKNSKFTEEQNGAYGLAQINNQKALIKGDAKQRKSLFNRTNVNKHTGKVDFVDKPKPPKDIARLRPEVLTDPASVEYIDGSVLEEIYKGTTLTADQREVLKQNIETAAAGQSPSKSVESAMKYLDTPNGQRNWGRGRNTESPTQETEPSLISTDTNKDAALRDRANRNNS